MTAKHMEPAQVINSPHPDEDALLFGKILLEWGFLEGALLGILLRLTHPRFKLKLKSKDFPRMLGKRIELAECGYAEIPAMSALQIEACQLLEVIRPLSKRRNIIVHGYYQGFTGNDTYMFGDYKSDPKKERGFHFVCFTRAELVKLTNDIISASSKLRELSAKTFLVPFPPLNSPER